MTVMVVRSMIGETVIVENKVKTGVDGHNNAVYETSETVVADVLVVPGPRADVVESNRPDGHLVKYTLHFPKTFNTPLESLRIRVRGRWLRVIGSPDHYTKENTPTRWWMPVEVGEVDG
jgi:hypothetical protein